MEFEDIVKERGLAVESFPYKSFEACMRASDLFVDSRSIKTRWDVLVAKGIVEEIGDSRYRKALIHLDRMGLQYPEMSFPELHTRTRTHINAEVGE